MLKLGERRFHIAAFGETARQRDGVFERQLGAGAYGKMRRVQRIAEQHHIAVMPLLVFD